MTTFRSALRLACESARQPLQWPTTRGVLAGRWASADGVLVHARVSEPAAEGRPLVFVHGVGVSGRYHLPTPALLAEHNPVYVPDLPGFGLSERPKRLLGLAALADVLLDWLDAEGIDAPVLVANSVGCQVVVQAAITRPERIDALVLQGPTVDSAARSWSGQLARWLASSRHEGFPQLPLMVRDYLDAGIRRTLSTFSLALADRPEDKLPALQQPTLVVRGELDPICSKEWAERVVGLLPNGRSSVLGGVGHTANFSAPHALADEIRAFLHPL